MMYVVELEPGVWIAPWEGDPGRTLHINHASVFSRWIDAAAALEKARAYRRFTHASIREAVDE